MRIGYSYWGFLGDHKMDADGNELSTPDGNATYSWSIIWEAQKRGHTVYAMQDDRDYPAWKRMREGNFLSFSTGKRLSAYENLKQTRGNTFPELDVLLLEWRFPIPGRNCEWYNEEDGAVSFGNPHEGKFQPDLLRQYELLSHYRQTKTRIVIWDLDHKLTERAERHWQPHAIFETSQTPLRLSMDRVQVEPPIDTKDLMQHPTLPSDSDLMMAYIGSRYERDDVIDEWIRPLSDAHPGLVGFVGKWDDEARARWPNIKFGSRCTTKDFRRIYGTASGCPLLAKRSYLETGFITPRPWEALMFGTIPVGLGSMKGIERYTPWVAHDPHDMIEIAETLHGADPKTRDLERRAIAEQLEFMDARFFVDKIEGMVR